MARDEKLMIRLTTEVKGNLERYANEYGMTMSALASYILGKWIADQKKMEPILEQTKNIAMSAVEKNIGVQADELNDFMKTVMPEIMQRMMESQGPGRKA